MRTSFSAVVFCAGLFLTSCETTPSRSGVFGPANMGGPSVTAREAQIEAEPTGNFFYGRRYHVNRTWFWGYLRNPRQPWSRARLVVFNQSQKRAPDNLPQDGPPGERHAYDNNFEYRIWGYYTGVTVYEPNSDQILPEFMLTGYELLNRNPGWLFTPRDHYSPKQLTLRP